MFDYMRYFVGCKLRYPFYIKTYLTVVLKKLKTTQEHCHKYTCFETKNKSGRFVILPFCLHWQSLAKYCLSIILSSRNTSKN